MIEPKKITYPGQASDEITLRVYYKHIMAIMPFIFVTVLLGILAFVGMTYGSFRSIELGKIIEGVNININLGVVGFLLLMLMLFFFVAIIWIWRRNIIVITNQHLVDIDQTGLFHRVVSTLSLSRIQDVRSDIKGPLQTLLQYGTIVVQTAGESQNFSFDYIPHPHQVERYILDIHHQYMQEHAGADDGVSAMAQGNQPAQNFSSANTPKPSDGSTQASKSEEKTPLDDLMNG